MSRRSNFQYCAQEEKLHLTQKEEELAARVDTAAARSACDEDELAAGEEAYVDRRWRRIVLEPFGNAWRERCHAACKQMHKMKAFPQVHLLV